MKVTTTSLCLLACLGAGCASAPWISPEERQQLTERIADVERRAAQSELEVARLRARLAELEAARTAPVAPRSVAVVSAPEAKEAHSAPPPDWARPRSAIEESELSEPEVQNSNPTPATASYEAALTLLRDGRAGEAETALAAFAAAHADSDLADNAWFWIGESRLVRGDVAGASEAYRTCIERYPTGNKVPDALLKLGQAFVLQGDTTSARDVWQELVDRYPNTAAAENARARLTAP